MTLSSVPRLSFILDAEICTRKHDVLIVQLKRDCFLKGKKSRNIQNCVFWNELSVNGIAYVYIPWQISRALLPNLRAARCTQGHVSIVHRVMSVLYTGSCQYCTQWHVSTVHSVMSVLYTGSCQYCTQGHVSTVHRVMSVLYTVSCQYCTQWHVSTVHSVMLILYTVSC
jgi:hypothetical protein